MAKSKKLTPQQQASEAAVVTHYPSGCFGIDYKGSLFFWWGFGEKNVRAELKRLKVDPHNVRWQEKYNDPELPFHDPRSYKTREFIPNNKPITDY